MALGVWLLLPLALGARSTADVIPTQDDGPRRTPSGFRWTVELHPGFLDVEAPIAVVESIVLLPLVLSSRETKDAVLVDVCESYECLLPRRVTVPPRGHVDVDALFIGRAPRLKVVFGDNGTRECCDRSLSVGRAIAFAGPAHRAFAFPNARDVAQRGGLGAFPVDAGTILQDRPELLDGFGAVLVDDGWAPRSLSAPLRRFVARGGVLSMLETDARALGLVPADAVVDMLSLSALGTAAGGGDFLDQDQLVVRLEDRMVRLNVVVDRVVRVAGGTLILRAPGRDESERLAQLSLAAPAFSLGGVQLDPRQLPIVNVASAGLSSERYGSAGFAVVVLTFMGIGLALWRGLRSSRKSGGPVRAAQGAVVVGVVGALVLVAMRLTLTGSGEVRLAQLGPGDGGRRVTAALGRAPGSYGTVTLEGSSGRFAGLPSTAMVVGESSWRTRLRQHEGKVTADLSSSSGLVGLWFGTDDTPGALRVTADGHGENTLPWRFDFVLLATNDGVQDHMRVVSDVDAGARFAPSDAASVLKFGTAVQERFARDVFNNCGRCAVGITTVDGVLLAVEGSR